MTDSELKAKMEANALEMAALKRVRKRGDAQEKRLAELGHDAEIYWRDYLDILARRRRGELTDPTRLDAAWKIISDRADAALIKVARKDVAGELNLGDIAKMWRLWVIYSGPLAAFDPADWVKLTNKLDEAVSRLDYVIRAREEDSWCTVRSRSMVSGECPP